MNGIFHRIIYHGDPNWIGIFGVEVMFLVSVSSLLDVEVRANRNYADTDFGSELEGSSPMIFMNDYFSLDAGLYLP